MEVSVRKDDSLVYYSKMFHIPLQLIIHSNPECQDGNMEEGFHIKIPGYDTINYRLQEGDNLATISDKFRVEKELLRLLNPGIDSGESQVGKSLIIPRRVSTGIVEGDRAYDYQVLMDDIRLLTEFFPFIEKRIIGHTVMGKPIPELRIGKGSKVVHVNGSFHANEWITTSVIMTFINEYVMSLLNEKNLHGFKTDELYEKVSLSIVPMVNPDGVDLVLNGAPDEEPYRTLAESINNGNESFQHWKANIRGVDLNNQFPARWELELPRKPTNPAPRDYPGDKPLTEPEAVAMAELTKQNDFDSVLAIHTQGKEFYWGFLGLEPPKSAAMAKAFSEISGYKAVRMIDSYAGYKDWFIQEWKKPGFTIELGEGVNPLPISQLYDIYNATAGIILMSMSI